MHFVSPHELNSVWLSSLFRAFAVDSNVHGCLCCVYQLEYLLPHFRSSIFRAVTAESDGGGDIGDWVCWSDDDMAWMLARRRCSPGPAGWVDLMRRSSSCSLALSVRPCVTFPRPRRDPRPSATCWRPISLYRYAVRFDPVLTSARSCRWPCHPTCGTLWHLGFIFEDWRSGTWTN